ncbi:MAG: hypothetical protein LBG21_05525 [Campylobacteraceae bacterium]|jgi:hypothetical protein|nr:hypothetical protein [Campylobacteraceae bacterium]
MRKKIIFLFFVIINVFFYNGCFATKQPIYNIQNAPIHNGDNLSYAQIEQAIIKAATELGWKINKVKNGLLVGIFTSPSYMAVIDIKYDFSIYNITYRDGANLQYDGSNIDKLYNNWIKSLNDTIQKKLSGNLDNSTSAL